MSDVGPAPVPAISVVIPVRNAVGTIGMQIDALLGQQGAPPFEIIVADNGSSDGTASEVRRRMERFPDLLLVDASRSIGAAAARNTGARHARGERLAFCDADDVVSERWVTAMSSALDRYAAIAGANDHDALNPGIRRCLHATSHQRGLPRALRFLPYALSANLGIRAPVFFELGGFAEDLDAVGEDIDLSWRLQLAGHEIGFEPEAVVAYRHRETIAAAWRQHVAYGFADPVLYRRFSAQGMPPLSWWTTAAAYGRLVARLPELASAEGRAAWLCDVAKRWGRLHGSVRERVRYL